MKVLSLTVLSFVSAAAVAAPPARLNDGVISTTTPGGTTITVTAISDNVIKVTNAPSASVLPDSKGAVLPKQPFKGKVSSSGNLQTLWTPTGVQASLDSSSGAVAITSGPGRKVSDPGLRLMKDGKRELELTTEGTGSFYGAGERGYSLNLAGDTLPMYNKQNYGYTAGEQRIRQMNITMPLFVSSNGYAVLFDDFSAADMIMGNPVKYVTESPSPVTYYYINGNGSIKETVKELTRLTGRQALPPVWALGYITSKYGYKTEAETRGVIDTLKLNRYPVDGVVLDLYWYGKEQDMGRLAWDSIQWPTHKQMLADLKAKGVNVVAISQPYVLRNGKALDNYNLLDSLGYFVKDGTDTLGKSQEVKIWVGEGGMFDVSNPDTRAWLRNRYKELTDEGMGGWWGDLGEPEVHPETGVHSNGLTARQYHNQYGNDWSSIIYDLYAEEYPDTRLMTLMRGGTTGLQRYSVFPWSTDVSRSWGGLAPQVIIMLNSGLSGLGYMSHDVGGFAIDEKKPYDPELYVRWLQLGLFSPVLRTHAQATAEPYRYPEQQDIILPLIKERYRWLPYNYTLAWDNARDGLPLVRPLNFYENGSNAYDHITDEYLWGSDVLVAPVLTQGSTERSVTFPQGQWVDYANPTKVYEGGTTITYPAPLNVLPLFVKAGAIIPTADYAMENTGDYRDNEYTFNIFPVNGCGGSYTLFEDNRTSAKSLEKKEYALVEVSDRMDGGHLNITLRTAPDSPNTPSAKTIKFVVHNISKAPKQIVVDGKFLGSSAYTYDKATSTLTFSRQWEPSSSSTIIIK